MSIYTLLSDDYMFIKCYINDILARDLKTFVFLNWLNHCNMTPKHKCNVLKPL